MAHVPPARGLRRLPSPRDRSCSPRRLIFEALEQRWLLHAAVTAVAPANGAQQVPGDTVVQVTFDHPVQPATVTSDTFQLRDPAGALVPASVSYDAASLTARLQPLQPLASVSDFYRATVRGGAEGVREADTDIPLEDDFVWHFTTQSPDFQEEIVFDSLRQPTAVAFSPDGRVFVAEKGGVLQVFDGLDDTAPTTVADLRERVFNFWDRGLLGLALDPQFPERPYAYVLYAYDFDPAFPEMFPRWGDATSFDDVCPDPPGANGEGCVVSGRLSRLTIDAENQWDGVEHVLVEDWAQQFPSHSLGSLAFDAEGALYASAGDGASFSFADYGQINNPLGDPPLPAGTPLSPPDAEGGALRAQDLLSPDDPLGLSGSVIRIDPDTGEGWPTNPLASSSDPNARRIVAHGLRNPFRVTVRPGTSQLWLGDVGWGQWEEINVLQQPADDRVDNFGWPAYEGRGRQGAYDGIDLTLLENLYNDPDPGAHVEPYFAYEHGQPIVEGEPVPDGGASISGLAFSQGGNLPAAFDQALFFSDFTRRGIWVMYPGPDGEPDPVSVASVLPNATDPVQLSVGPEGDLFYVDLLGGTIRRLRFMGVEKPPTAVATADRHFGSTPLIVRFDGSESNDRNPDDTLTFAWDLDGDGQFDDSSDVSPLWVYPEPGIHEVGLQVTDSTGRTDIDRLSIQAGNTPPTPVIELPATNDGWSVGDLITFAGQAADQEDGMLGAERLRWDIVIYHCEGNGCHTHPVTSLDGATGGSFNAPDHEYPSYLELRLTATDSWGLQASTQRRLDPRTVNLTTTTSPAGLAVSLNRETLVDQSTRAVIVGSNNSLTAPSPQVLDDVGYRFQSWSDGGERTHNVQAGATDQLFTARFSPILPTYLSDLPLAAPPVNAWGPPERDAANGEQASGDGGPIRIDGRLYSKGFGVHADSELVFELDGRFDRFLADVGVDDAKQGRGSVTFEVWTDGTKIHDSGVVRGGWPARPIDVSVSGARQLRLVVTDGGDGIDSDHADWAAARLLARDEFIPPALVRNELVEVNVGGQAVLDAETLLYEDNVQPHANIVYSVTEPLAAGRLERSTDPGVPINLFTQADLDRHSILLVHTGDSGGPDQLRFSVQDGQGNALGDQVLRVQAVQATYVSDLPYAEPPSNGWGPPERDRSNGEWAAGDGGSLTIEGVTYAKGLGVHAPSDVAFDLRGDYQRLLADIGVDDEVGPNGSVVFEVWGDGQRLFSSDVLTGVNPARRIDVDVSAVERLRLVVTDAGDSPGWDHADWADVRLIPVADLLPPVREVLRSTLVAPAGRVLLTRDELRHTDAQPPSILVYEISQPPQHGQLERVDAPGVPIDRFTQRDVDEGRVLYAHFGASGEVLDAFRFQVHDSQGNRTIERTYEIQVSELVWLSDLPFSLPPINGWGPVERDASNGEEAAGDGIPLTLNGLVYGKGLGVHALSDLSFDLAGNYARLLADVGVDDEITAGGSVMFQVWLDETLAYQSDVLGVDDAPRRVDLDVSGHASLRLVVTDGGDGPGWDHADWAGAGLVLVDAPAAGGEGEAAPRPRTGDHPRDAAFALFEEASPIAREPRETRDDLARPTTRRRIQGALPLPFQPLQVARDAFETRSRRGGAVPLRAEDRPPLAASEFEPDRGPLMDTALEFLLRELRTRP